MITPEWVQMMARYNAWQNNAVYTAVDQLSEDARRADRGAFFGSIHETLCHILWGDRFWMSRFAGWDKPERMAMAETGQMITDWADLKAARRDADARISDWATRVDSDWLNGITSRYSGVKQREVCLQTAICVTHFFNHQTHHRGQVHAMLTAAGVAQNDMVDSDLVFMEGLET